ncbi:kinase-like protein [Aspergillus neoniger CBS 115656]|uniref:cyclin-dependent kinase n=1 Tax=Aspergillus neoniger (strain CBS 115656) TaxID=1448310 RepID=A0A318Y9Q1_ASPNB|nr:kinase-like protein [Aspergillus neoniger CBS 115656]PYH29033.1 kinase-like protein [Aspergillus neoniger CBS 115656]
MSAFLMSSLAWLICQGERGTRYRLVRPLGTPARDKPSNVWLAIDDSRPDAEYVIKIPPGDNNHNGKLFAKGSMIRRLVDYVPESELAGPMMVFEAFTDSLWDARNARPFTTKEIKWIMKGVLLGIYTVHMKGLVYTVSKPSTREITSLTYRSPEVHFGRPWSSSTDVWSWGIILAQLFQAQVDFISPGMYDSIRTGSMRKKRDAIRDQLAVDFDLSSLPFYAEDEQCARILPTPQPETAYMWANTMVEKGVSHEDIQFLVEILHPDPNARLTVREILESEYLDG